MKQLAMLVGRAAPNPPARGSGGFGNGIAMPTLRISAYALIAVACALLPQPAKTAEIILSCVWQSRGPAHEKRTVEITVDQQMQRAQVGGNYSLPATISDTRISFSLNISGSVFQYVIDRTSGLGTITIKDEVMYSGVCKGADPAHRSS